MWKFFTKLISKRWKQPNVNDDVEPTASIEHGEDGREYFRIPKLDLSSDSRIRLAYKFSCDEETVQCMLMLYGTGPEARRLREADMRRALADPNHIPTVPLWTSLKEVERIREKLDRHHNLDRDGRPLSSFPTPAPPVPDDMSDWSFRR